MSVDWQYDILFAFQVSHPDDGVAQGFSIQPTITCGQLLARYGLIFKPMPNGGAVIVEKKVPENPADTPEPVRKIKGVAQFSFILSLNNYALLTDTIPFHLSSFPAFVGRSRILYFDNLDENNLIDQDLDHPPQMTLSNMDFAVYEMGTDGAVSDKDLGSLGLNQFEYYANPQQTNTFQVTPILPNGGTTETWPINNNNKRVALKLADGPYTIKQSGEEVFYAASSLLRSGPFGLIHIFKDEQVDYNTTIRYDIIFEKV
ncbi:MAG TPA: hypothetical protein PKA00_04500 [Saprospiraceae bacterium]|nr:hypothetical protein [Saprospiraceae bacterium]HMQ82140.1 hypothetical protein [Saprospiraceae bacterium]